MWNKWNKIDWWPIRIWPKRVAQDVISEKLNNVTRFSLILYLVGNGIHPNEAEDWILEMAGHYKDDAAKRQVIWLLRNTTKLSRFKYWDEIAQEYRKFTPVHVNYRPREVQREKREWQDVKFQNIDAWEDWAFNMK